MTALIISMSIRTSAGTKVTEQGSPKELYKNKTGVFRRMADLQASSAGWSV